MENINLLKKIAQSFSVTTGIDFDDLFQEAYIAYQKAIETHDPSKSKLSTHAWNCIQAHLKNYVKEEQKHNAMSIDTPEVLNAPALSLASFFDTLSFEAQQLVKIIQERSPKFLYLSKEETLKRLEHTMVRRGWNEKKIQVSLKELCSI